MECFTNGTCYITVIEFPAKYSQEYRQLFFSAKAPCNLPVSMRREDIFAIKNEFYQSRNCPTRFFNETFFVNRRDIVEKKTSCHF